jgi:hypothetical protein
MGEDDWQWHVKCVLCYCTVHSGRLKLRGEYFCGTCYSKYHSIPAHIPIDQFKRYYKRCRKKAKTIHLT